MTNRQQHNKPKGRNDKFALTTDEKKDAYNQGQVLKAGQEGNGINYLGQGGTGELEVEKKQV